MKAFPSNALAGAPDGFRIKAVHRQGAARLFDDDPSRARRLHRLRRVRRCLPGQEQGSRQAQSDQHGGQSCRIWTREQANFDFFLDIPEFDRTPAKIDTVKGSQLLQPLFEFSGACAGCGETPYLKLMSQLFGDRAVIGNATGCSSIYGGNLPTTPWAQNAEGRGPAWNNSLFEDTAEFGLGLRMAVDQKRAYARISVEATQRPAWRRRWCSELIESPQTTESGIR